ncbi:MAG: amino acid transport protein [Luteolibacter sp.]
MLNFNPYNLLAGLIFGTIGWGAFIYGRRLELDKPKFIGVALIIYPYLISHHILVWVLGVALVGLIWVYRHD